MNESPPIASQEEQEQIVQTIEMFEVIVEANPHDCQSMEILKDAYLRVGLTREALRIARKLAETYVELGQLSSALLEYEGILHQDQTNVEVMAALGEVEDRMHQSGLGRPAYQSSPQSISLDFQAAVEAHGGLSTTPETLTPAPNRQAFSAMRAEELIAALTEDGNEPLARFLIQHRLMDSATTQSALQLVQKKNREREASSPGASLIDELVRRGADHDSLLCGILDRSKFAYIPLDCYDVDRQIVKMLPEALTLGRLLVPFDLISRTIMVATANPFDVRGKEAVQQVLDFNIQWHLASPAAILKVLAETYRVPSLRKDSTFKLAS